MPEVSRQGRHAEAREHHVKCVDVTPQMAFQLIKVRFNSCVVRKCTERCQVLHILQQHYVETLGVSTLLLTGP